MKKPIGMMLTLLVSGLLFGCADSSQVGLEKQTDVRVEVRVVQESGNTGNVYIAPTGELSQITGDTEQETAAIAEASPDFTIPVAQQGGQANIESSTTDAEAKQDNRQTDSNNATSSTPGASTAVPVLDPTTGSSIDNDDAVVAPGDQKGVIPKNSTGSEVARFYKRAEDNDRPIWYFSKAMSEYPENFNVTMEGCGTIHIRGNTKGVRQDFDEEYKPTAYNKRRDRTFISQTRFDPIKRPDKPQVMTMVGPVACKTEKAVLTLLPPVEKKPLTYKMNPYKTKSLVWFPRPESGPVVFVFDQGCESLTVRDPSKIWGEDGNPDNLDQRFYFPGDHPGQDTNNGLASVFTAPGCVSKNVIVKN